MIFRKKNPQYDREKLYAKYDIQEMVFPLKMESRKHYPKHAL